MGRPLIQKVFGIGNPKIFFLKVFSSNYALYGDMSRRVMKTLAAFAPNIEQYSIDEAFLDLSDCSKINLTQYGRKIKRTVKQNTGIPVPIGIAKTKTLAKTANYIAKKSNKADGMLNLSRSIYHDQALKIILVEDVWGVGRKYARFLKSIGITNTFQLRNTDEKLIKGKMGINGARLIQELKGIACAIHWKVSRNQAKEYLSLELLKPP